MPTKYKEDKVKNLRGITFGHKFPDLLWEIYGKIRLEQKEEDENGINKRDKGL